MPDILFIKTSSLGDVVHHMPAVADVRHHYPDARISWVVEEAYAPLVGMHPMVDRVIAVATRRWRRLPLKARTWREIGAVRRELRASAYDFVIDTQGLLRSALIARSARGRRHGYDRESVREPLAALFYDVRHRIERAQHAVARNRALTGAALGYAPDGPPDYGLGSMRPSGGVRTAMLLHGTTRTTKEWPVTYWQRLAKALSAQGFSLLLPSGSAAELDRSQEIATGIEAELLDRQPLDALAHRIAAATVVIGVDTGLMHLAAAFGVPLVAIFTGGSDPRLTGPVGAGPITILGQDGAVPSVPAVLAAVESVAGS
jgi:heptosyltransferase-1